MSKKNKGGIYQTPSAKAARNLEALKKAKEVIESKAKVEETKVEDPKPEEKKVEEKPAEEKKKGGIYQTPTGKTAYETHMLCTKLPYMSLLSLKIEKDSKGIENIKADWKNNETSETTSVLFPVSNVKKGDGIDVKQIKEGIKNPIPAKTPEAKPAEESKKEDPKPEPVDKKPKQQKSKKEKIEEVEAEEIDLASTPTIKTSNSPVPNVVTQNSDRIDANHSVDLMNAILKRREEIKDDRAMYQATGKQADLMMFVLIQKWNNQFKNDAKEQGFAVNEEMFNYLNDTASLFLGVNLLPSKTSDGQLEINFKDAVAKTNPEMQKALEQDAKAPESQSIPKPEECVTDEQKIAAICTIVNMRHKQKSGGIGKNITNMIEFARSAYNLDKDAEPAQVLATVLLKMKEAGRNATLLEGCTNAVWGNLNGNLSVLAAHAWLKNQLTTYNDAQVANVVKVFLAKKITDETVKSNNYEEEAKQYSQLISGTNDDLINRIITSAKNEGKDEDKLVYPDIKGLNLKGKHISAVKTVNNLRIAYGTEMSDKMMKQIMQQVSSLYSSTSLNPLTFYVEKSAYATKK
jgi:hypothetical protein